MVGVVDSLSPRIRGRGGSRHLSGLVKPELILIPFSMELCGLRQGEEK